MLPFVLFFLPAVLTYYSETISLDSLEVIFYQVNFTSLYKNGLGCGLWVSASSSNYESTSIYSTTCSEMFHDSSHMHTYVRQLYIWNFQLTSSDYQIILSTTTDSSDETLLYQNQLILQKQILTTSSFIGAVLIKDYASDYMLPFNLLSEKTIKSFVELEECHLSVETLPNQPFLDTFWNQLGSDQIIMPWLPYFSNCNASSSRILLHELLKPSDCELEVNDWGEWKTICSQQSIVHTCILEELYVESQKQNWWQNQDYNPYYFMATSLTLSELKTYYTDSSKLQTAVNQYYSYLVPLVYIPDFDLKTEIPNLFTFQFDVHYTYKGTYQLINAKLTSSKSSSLSNAQLHIHVNYLSDTERYLKLSSTIMGEYILTFAAIIVGFAVLCGMCGWCHWMGLTKKIKIILFPMMKGNTYALFISCSFYALLFGIASNTYFSSISTTFNADVPTDEEYYGRVGLTIFMAGFYFLNSAINQSFKVWTVADTKLLLDDQQQKQNSENTESTDQKQNFIIKNMNSHLKYLFLCIFLCPLLLLFLYYQFLEVDYHFMCFAITLLYPIVQKVLFTLYRYYLIKELLYSYAIRVSIDLFFDLYLLKGFSMGECVLFYGLKLVADFVLVIGLELACQFLGKKLYEVKRDGDNTCFTSMLRKQLKQPIKTIGKETKYEKSLLYACLITSKCCSTFSRIYYFPLIYFSLKFNNICRDFQIGKQQLLYMLLMLFLLGLIDYVLVCFVVKVFDWGFALPVSRVLEFNQFKFNSRKSKFLNDNFSHNQCIGEFFREIENFCFSSQFYLLIGMITFSILTIFLGLKIVIETNFVAFRDPAFIILCLIVWICGQVLSLMLSFLVIKFKVYNPKQRGKMRAKLDTIEKFLKKTDYSEYLDVEGVKNYFLFHCKEWILRNLGQLLNKEDFEQNNSHLIVTYKYYKSLLKKREIEERKRKQHLQKKKTVKQAPQTTTNQPLIIIPSAPFKEYTKSLLISWLYMAKQFTFLKKLIEHIAEERIKDVCEYCSMNIQLQAIQKHDFIDIVNEYRVLNVGRMFIAEHFVSFYRYRQEYMTVCIECKDTKVNLMKKNVSVSVHGITLSLLKKWVIMARSRILHHPSNSTPQK